MKRSKFEAKEIRVLSVIKNELMLLADDEKMPPFATQILLAQASHIQSITLNHGSKLNRGGVSIKEGITHEWPKTKREIGEAMK